MDKNKIPEKLLKPYDPKTAEDAIYKRWKKAVFNPDNLPGERKERYAIIMPPPNANGRLHTGHGTDLTLKDILIRFERMRGKKTLPSSRSDHGGFETQGVYEKNFKKKGVRVSAYQEKRSTKKYTIS